jgi:hypothetical protein
MVEPDSPEYKRLAPPNAIGRTCRRALWIGLVVKVTPAASVSFFRPEFNDFLYAQISADRNEMPLSVLSALSRLDIDPWEKAAELAELPTEAATRVLSALLARLPSRGGGQADSRAIADRLIELLPCRSSSKVSPADATHGVRTISLGTRALICAALGLAALFIAASREPSRDGPVDPPVSNTASPAQVSVPISR